MLKYGNIEQKNSDKMEKLHFSCASCNSEKVIYKNNKEHVVQVGNPKVVKFVSDCYECQDCGETYFDEEMMKKSAKQVDEQLKVKG